MSQSVDSTDRNTVNPAADAHPSAQEQLLAYPSTLKVSGPEETLQGPAEADDAAPRHAQEEQGHHSGPLGIGQPRNIKVKLALRQPVLPDPSQLPRPRPEFAEKKRAVGALDWRAEACQHVLGAPVDAPYRGHLRLLLGLVPLIDAHRVTPIVASLAIPQVLTVEKFGTAKVDLTERDLAVLRHAHGAAIDAQEGGVGRIAPAVGDCVEGRAGVDVPCRQFALERVRAISVVSFCSQQPNVT